MSWLLGLLGAEPFPAPTGQPPSLFFMWQGASWRPHLLPPAQQGFPGPFRGGEWVGQATALTLSSAQPTVRFAEDTLLLPGEDGESEEGQLEAPWSLPGGRQRLIRKDTPHYKKHFKISKLPQPEAVVALLQGTQPDSEVVGPGGWHNGPHLPWAPRAEVEEAEEEEAEEEEEEEEEVVAVAAEAEEEKEEAVASVPSVKVGLAPRTHPAVLAPRWCRHCSLPRL